MIAMLACCCAPKEAGDLAQIERRYGGGGWGRKGGGVADWREKDAGAAAAGGCARWTGSGLRGSGQTRARAHTHTHTHARTHARTHTRSRARTHTRTHTHTRARARRAGIKFSRIGAPQPEELVEAAARDTLRSMQARRRHDPSNLQLTS